MAEDVAVMVVAAAVMAEDVAIMVVAAADVTPVADTTGIRLSTNPHLKRIF